MTTKAHIRLIATGGTIAGAGDGVAASGYSSGQVSVQHLLPNWRSDIHCSLRSPYQIGSQHAGWSHWLMLLAEVMNACVDDSVDAVVILHGSDTLEECAFFLHSLLPQRQLCLPKPIILTAAMRPATALSADGQGNLNNAISVCLSLLGPAHAALKKNTVWVVMQNRAYAGIACHKFMTMVPDAFALSTASALVLDDEVIWSNLPWMPPWLAGWAADALPLCCHHDAQTGWHANLAFTPPDVSLLTVQFAVPALRWRQFLQPWPAGIVLAGMGHGSIPQTLAPLIHEALAAGIPVVRASKLPMPGVFQRVEQEPGEANNQVMMHSAQGLTAAQAAVALALCLVIGRGWVV